ncbi:unnamed protein product [Tilletia controversa]|uniref:Uncharacterized protein n=3 Tax=Tilletia TaxID=13289 RepID=A0A8X7SY63_9BASI|nr:hypothetical protein CF336_g7767 [Tilletia laevis]KAE8185326.1 hypothetical protein CF328_g7580 [Tilletia controversa]KAE8247726.1 hypothetical protein A4X03_0g6973 [Tilletia caries]KAE8187578.1 hypothetical protein CF335_g7132 [Tilletia laevis]KAE8249045.1 hypothetical protein A4X06_0g3409 [Tilletia controversa]
MSALGSASGSGTGLGSGLPEECFTHEAFSGSIGLRVGAIFILWVSSSATTLFPIVTRRIPKCAIPASVFDFCKYFGSGVIIATAFIHLLAPGADELGSPCLSETFQNYDFAFAFAMISMFMVFLVELVAFRIGSAKAASLAYDPHTGGHHHANEHNGPVSPQPQAQHQHTHAEIEGESNSDVGVVGEKAPVYSDDKLEEGTVASRQAATAAKAQEIIGVAILEFGVIFHSVIIGITLGTTSDFTTLFVVIIFHQMFEGLGLGTRLAYLPLHPDSWLPFLGGIAYGLVTPIGLAIGLGIRSSYNEDSATANYVTGTFDSISAGILLYTGLVELLAHEFIFSQKMRQAPISKVLTSVGEMFLGAALMALLGRWA